MSINRTLKSGHNSRRRKNYCRNFNQTMKSGHRNNSTIKADGGGLGRSSDSSCTLDSLSVVLTGLLGVAFVGNSVKLALLSQKKAMCFNSIPGLWCNALSFFEEIRIFLFSSGNEIVDDTEHFNVRGFFNFLQIQRNVRGTETLVIHWSPEFVFDRIQNI